MDTADDFRAYVSGRQRALLRTAWLLTGDWSAAEDLVQTSLVKAWPHWRRVRDGNGADAYVRRIMVNTFLDWRRRRWTGEVPTDVLPDEPGGDGHDDIETRRLLLAAIRALPPRQRAVIALRYLDDQSEAETASLMGCSVGTVKSQAAKALVALRQHPELCDVDSEGTRL